MKKLYFREFSQFWQELICESTPLPNG